jgi:hypothetical protein
MADALIGAESSRIAEFICCSTGISPAFDETETYNGAFRQGIAEASGVEPTMLVTGYECASWGYVLRYLQHSREARTILMVIMDVNLPYLSQFDYNPAWGKSGFGVAILRLRIEPDYSDHLLVSHTTSENGLFEFVRAVKSFADQHPRLRVALPFFPKATQPAVSRPFGARALPDLHDEYGHCFGSDPWLSIIRTRADSPGSVGPEVLAASFALAGYYCAARILLSPTLRTALDTLT